MGFLGCLICGRVWRAFVFGFRWAWWLWFSGVFVSLGLGACFVLLGMVSQIWVFGSGLLWVVLVVLGVVLFGCGFGSTLLCWLLLFAGVSWWLLFVFKVGVGCGIVSIWLVLVLGWIGFVLGWHGSVWLVWVFVCCGVGKPLLVVLDL